MMPGADGKPEWHERAPTELARLRRLVQSAIGYDAKRGDTVEIVSMRFTETPELLAAPEGCSACTWTRADMISLAQSSILGAVVLLALLFIVRPMALRLAAVGEASGGGEMMLEGDEPRALPAPMGLSPAGGAAALLADESMVEMANIEGQLRASSLRKLSELVEKHPDESLNIMRGWMSQERA